MTIEVVEGRSASDTRRILEALPDWFCDPAAIDNYVEATDDPRYESMVAISPTGPVGIALSRRHFHEAAELHLIAVDPGARRSGVGRSLVERVASVLAADGCSLLSVHTVGPSFQNEPYAHTRAFYRSVGFTPLEEHDGLDWPGPTLILVRPLQAADREEDVR
ncbi:GNAT family N-acetyltransferase [Curtobacterium sp. MCBD17_040]|uniref:GNAT family N-acetyltransferase n=1 Tax=Curtobacterium sp. MCBD17_040 TaxID=2175674 RepID=UPI000DA7B750|nr:GNAT family N-acetyltransferase [Curtobacterium sp. MCBD17_040]WIB65787.1 GNAT family N-acetyltransferase [Curtobacterium sp. MCBD17_040]